MTELGPLEGVSQADIETLLDRAFGRERKAKTAYRLREGTRWLPALSFAAHRGDTLVGTLQSWPVMLDATPLVMVGPVAVGPDSQNGGVGTLLMNTLLAAAGRDDTPALMMIGDPVYYGRFGFTADRTGGWSAPGPVDRHRLLARIRTGQRLPRIGVLKPAT